MGAEATLSEELCSGPEGPVLRHACKTLPCTLIAPGACKIRRGGYVVQVPVQIIPLGVTKRESQNCHGMSPDHP